MEEENFQLDLELPERKDCADHVGVICLPHYGRLPQVNTKIENQGVLLTVNHMGGDGKLIN